MNGRPARLRPTRRSPAQPCPAQPCPAQHRAFSLHLAALLAASTLAGCREPPDEVLGHARDALAEVNRISCSKSEQLQDALQDLGRHLEPRAAALVQAAPQVERGSSGQFKVFATCKPPPSILPAGEVLQVETQQQTARVVVQAKGKKSGVVVPMVLVDGRWKIALLDMDSMAQALAVH
jgi:hypothetical protein